MAKRSFRGKSRIFAAAFGAPAAALLGSLALCRALPLAPDVMLFAFFFFGLPLVALAPCAALLAPSCSSAWAGSLLVAVASAALLVLG